MGDTGGPRYTNFHGLLVSVLKALQCIDIFGHINVCHTVDSVLILKLVYGYFYGIH